MTKIDPSAAYYIKLGTGGSREAESIKAGTLWLGYEEIPHELCEQGKWTAVRESIVEQYNSSPRAATDHLRQLQVFYEAGDDVLWVTFHEGKLWWGFAGTEVTFLPDHSRTRRIIGGWSSETTANKKPLAKSRLSGRLLSMEGYRGTICKVHAIEYLVRKINDETSPEEEAVAEARKQLVGAIEKILDRLHWKDFELLVDLIFRAGGMQRISEVGGLQKDIDLVLLSPITGESYTVQVKSSAGRGEYEQYVESTSDLDQFACHYFVVHKPEGLTAEMAVGSHELWLPEKIATLVIQYGLVDWVIEKAA